LALVVQLKKEQLLKDLGCERVINLKKENLGQVLQKEYQNGIDFVYESIGGDVFGTCIDNLGVEGLLIIIGMISGYKDGTYEQKSGVTNDMLLKLLTKSAGLQGFFLAHYQREGKMHFERLSTLLLQNKIKSYYDDGHGKFVGLSSISDALDYMYSGKNIGKVVVKIGDQESPALNKSKM